VLRLRSPRTFRVTAYSPSGSVPGENGIRALAGSPSFVVGGELFWGNDRLEDILVWHQAHTIPDEVKSYQALLDVNERGGRSPMLEATPGFKQ
ncbi:MAG: hypothetical protein M3122_06580, partial [Actinomycetota bacterium]|nr:hypothetical protein [Actinomycetota bacterium]